jgi:Sulfotransferase family
MSKMEAARAGDGFEVARWVDAVGGFVNRRPRLWIALGNIETRLMADEISATAVEEPVFISGLARAGSTILLEILARHPDVVSHRYQDYPLVFTPFWWNRLLERMPKREVPPAERTHQDGIAVGPASPEAFEEVLWMAFFPDLHQAPQSDVLGDETSHPEFEAFYREHIRKLVRVRGGRRYLSKGNYNATRLEYLQKLFPDARFVIPVRDPVWHIASLMKQHALFCKGCNRHPEAVRHLQRVGHFEFGLDRRPINAGDPARLARIADAWQRGDEVEGWSLYWAQIYGYLADRLAANPALKEAALVVRFEDMCRAPHETLERALAHCRLDASPAWLEDQAAVIRFPSYYRPRFTDDDLATIERHTAATARRFGYAGTSEPVTQRSGDRAPRSTPVTG